MLTRLGPLLWCLMDQNYKGCMLTIIQQNANINNDCFSDRVESIQIEGNCKWIFYEHINFMGSAHILEVGYHSSAPKWGGAGNRISSARVYTPPTENNSYRTLSTHQLSRSHGSSDIHLPNLDFNDYVSSIIIMQGPGMSNTQSQGKWMRLNAGEYHSHVSP